MRCEFMTMSNFSRPVLVTGGSGFIGSHMLDALDARGLECINLDIRPPQLARDAASWRQGDLRDQAAVEAVVRETQPGVIFNLAAYADLKGDLGEMTANTDGCRHLIRAVEKLGHSPLIVHTSTQLVAGPGSNVSGDQNYAPYSPYGESKAESERIFQALPDGFRWTITRPTNVWGARHPSFSNAIWKYIRRGLYMHPNRPVLRSYGYVENVVEQYFRIAEAEPFSVEGHVFYVGDEAMDSAIWVDAFAVAFTGKAARRVPMCVLKAAAILGEISDRVGGPSPINLGRLHRLTTDYVVPMEPTFLTIGRGPIDFQTGIERTLAWLRETGD